MVWCVNSWVIRILTAMLRTSSFYSPWTIELYWWVWDLLTYKTGRMLKENDIVRLFYSCIRYLWSNMWPLFFLGSFPLPLIICYHIFTHCFVVCVGLMTHSFFLQSHSFITDSLKSQWKPWTNSGSRIEYNTFLLGP